jgi:stearoyl-CoA desaturase (Delta-9 desaturase)
MADASHSFARAADERIDPITALPFVAVHLLPLLAIWTGAGWQEWVVCTGLYVVRMFGVTAGYHRYFAHRTYKLGRIPQFLLAFLATTSSQKGVLWWAGHHRHHHKFSDMAHDIHSPKRGFLWSHMGWVFCHKYDETPTEQIRDFAKYPELVLLNRYWFVPPMMLGLACLLLGGWSMLLIGFFLSTALLWHGTFTINSLSHVFGSRRFATTDTSRNNWLLAFLTLGEGWHNNHHHWQASTNQGFYWWEIDVTFYVIKVLEKLGIAHDVRTPPAKVLLRNRIDHSTPAKQFTPASIPLKEQLEHLLDPALSPLDAE